MKTSKIRTTIAALNLILFMSVSIIANPIAGYEGDIIKTGAKKHIEAVKGSVAEIVSPSTFENEFSNLRFDVEKFVKTNETEIYELPASTEFSYLRFDVNKYADSTSTSIEELPLN